MTTEYKHSMLEWVFEMDIARKNGVRTMPYEDWLNFRESIDALFEELDQALIMGERP